jgi:glycosyltransferase involved in cell wall biosynthesis
MELHVRSLARQLQAQGHDVSVVTTESVDRSERIDGIQVERLSGMAQRMAFAFSNGARRYPPPLVDPELARKIQRCLERIRPDVIHAHGWIVYSVIAANVDRRPLVVTLHDYGYVCPKKTFLRQDGECVGGRGRQCLACASAEYGTLKSAICYVGTGIGMHQLTSVDAFVAVSSYVKARSEPYLHGRPIHVIPNFLSPQVLAAERDPGTRAALPERFVLYVGVLAPFKGVDDLIAAHTIVRQRSSANSDLQLVLAGRVHPSQHYHSQPEDGIHVLHNPPRGLVVEALASCESLVVPSRWPEPCPTVVLEGICAGRPVIGTRAGGIPELLAGVPLTQVVSPSRPGELADAISAVAYVGGGAPDWGGPPNYLPLQPERVAAALVDVYTGAIARESSYSPSMA